MEAAEEAWQGAAGSQGGPTEQQDPNDEHNSPLFAQDDFRLWCMKVIPCTKRFVHDWTICPFAHAGEKAVRRDPRLHNYTGIACPDMKKTGSCIRGEKCPYAHNVFEYWLHPTRYRTQLCNDGPMCKRSICFFAHSLEELRVPACKPYVSPEALARASLEAIQQNPHPLGQQLTNPAVAAAQQQAAMAALTRPPGTRPAREYPPHAHLAPSAAPFVPGGNGGGYRPSGEPVRYSAPGAPQLLTTSGNSAEFGAGSYGGDFGAPPHQSYGAQRWTAPPQQHGGYHPPNPVRHSGGSYGSSAGSSAAAHSQYHSHNRFSSPTLSGSYGSGRLSSSGRAGSGPMSFSAGATPFLEGAGAGDASAAAAAALRKPPPQPAPQATLHGPPAGYMSAHVGARQAPAQGAASRSFAAVQQPPAQGFTGMAAAGQDSNGAPGAPSMGRAGSARSARTSDNSRSEEEAAGSPGSGAVAGASGRTSPAPDHDLAQSLASLKIAMTQQQLAAAAGSNHEVVITTLHQILKDAMAQQGGSFGAEASSAAMSTGSLNAPLEPMPPGLPATQQHTAQLSAGNTSVAWQSGSSPDVSALSLGRQVSGRAPSAPASPEHIACYEAAVVAAKGGYPGVAPVAAVPLAGSLSAASASAAAVAEGTGGV